MTTHVNFVIDIETKSKFDNAIITRIAITPFNFDEGKLSFEQLVERTLYLSINQQEQIDAGRVSDKLTEDWWSLQSEELRKESYYPTDNDLPVGKVLEECARFMRRWNYHYSKSFLWQRNGFEAFKLSSLNMQFKPGEKEVFNPWSWHEVKTMYYVLSGGETQKLKLDHPEFNEHCAKHDTAADAWRLLQLWHQS